MAKIVRGHRVTEVWEMTFSHLVLTTVLRVGVIALFYGGRNRRREKR